MSRNQRNRERISQELNDDERAIIEFCRAEGLSKEEALQRLSTPSATTILIQGQELAANLQAVAAELSKSQSDPASLSGHDDPT